MKITESTVQMTGRRAAVEHHERREGLRMWKDGAGEIRDTSEQRSTRLSGDVHALLPGRPGVRPAGAGSAPPPVPESPRPERGAGPDVLKLSHRAQGVRPMKRHAEALPAPGPMENLEMSIVRRMVEELTGREMKFFDPSGLRREMEEAGQAAAETGREIRAAKQEAEEAASAGRAGWGVVYEYSEHHYEAERTVFSADGVVKTADGREIEFSADLRMSREFTSRERISLRAGDALKDPLVINFDGTAAELTEDRFSFDIDVDGKEDQVAFVGPGSGFLALDKNRDGRINDGGELFGARTGDGFAELAGYDDDGNDWIDENDSIYVDLRVWSRDAQGNDSLMALGRRDVGAIYLGNAETEFSVRNGENELQGRIRATGIYLPENGAADTVQHLDLVV